MTARTDPGTREMNERAALIEWLDYHRTTLRWKCEGLSDDQLRTASIAPSNMTLLGLIRHMTEVEMQWFSEVFDGRDEVEVYSSPDDRDGDWIVGGASVREAWTTYDEWLAISREVLDGCHDLDAESAMSNDEWWGGTVNMRWILIHMIEEYPRHNGHADLLREAIDGVTGD